jgi:LacI family transcriptional regulator
MDHGIPLVFFDRVVEELKTGKVVTDDFEGGYIATRHLIEQGCKKVYFLSVSACLSAFKKRMEGFMKALNENNQTSAQNNVYQIPIDDIGNLETIKLLFSGTDKRPDGIVISAELLTMPIYNACRELNINIPEELKVVCFSNLLYAPLLSPPLSTITQPAFEIGHQAAGLICNAIDRFKDIDDEKIICPSRLDVRRSSAG